MKTDLDDISMKIIQVARSLFEENGYDKVNMFQIAKAAGIGQGTLYRRFSSINDLSMAIVDEDSKNICQNSIAYLSVIKYMPVKEQLCAFLKMIIHFFDNEIKLVGFPKPDNIIDDSMEESPFYVFLFSTTKGFLEEAKRQNILKPIDIDFTALMLNSCIINPELIYRMRQQFNLSIDDYLNNCQALMIDSLFIDNN